MTFDICTMYDTIRPMRKILLLLLCCGALCACGVRSDLAQPTGPLRDYPVY